MITKKYKDVEDWLDSEGYVKQARLIAPHAMEVQQHFASKLTRVGMPVAPPFPTPLTIQVFAKNEDGTLARLGKDILRGVAVEPKDFQFTAEGFSEILSRVAEGVEHYTAIRESYEGGNARAEKMERNILKLRSFLGDCEEWFSMIEDRHKIPGERGFKLGSKGIFQVFCTPDLRGAECMIALNLTSDSG